MINKSTILNKLADKLLKSTDLSDAFNKSKQASGRIKKLHEAITDRYKFEISNHKDCSQTELDANFVKYVEKKLNKSYQDEYKIEALFKKYKID